MELAYIHRAVFLIVPSPSGGVTVLLECPELRFSIWLQQEN